jgi:hypothetical protein
MCHIRTPEKSRFKQEKEKLRDAAARTQPR